VSKTCEDRGCPSVSYFAVQTYLSLATSVCHNASPERKSACELACCVHIKKCTTRFHATLITLTIRSYQVVETEHDCTIPKSAGRVKKLFASSSSPPCVQEDEGDETWRTTIVNFAQQHASVLQMNVIDGFIICVCLH